VTLPSHVYGDNAASLFLARNNQLGQRSKHIDIRDRFLHEKVEDGTVELRHVRSEDNTSDINSKNTSVEIHQKLADKLYEGIPLVHVVNGGLQEPDKEDVALVALALAGGIGMRVSGSGDADVSGDVANGDDASACGDVYNGEND